jgi:chromatin assembly factor 1 subunit B
VVRYSPILYELRPGVAGVEPAETKLAVIEKDVEGVMDVDVVGQRDPVASPAQADPSSTLISPRPTPSLRPVGHSRSQSLSSVGASPLVGPIDTGVSAREQPTTGSVFALPYRMLYAVLTMDSVAIYDTQQSPPLCLLTKLHYDEFTDATWCAGLFLCVRWVG